MSSKRLNDIEEEMWSKERKCELITLNQQLLSDQFKQLQKELFDMSIKKNLLVSRLNHPLFCNLQNILPEDIITFCIEYSNILICARCFHSHPCQLVRTNELYSKCFRHEGFFTYTRVNDEIFDLSGDVYIDPQNETIKFYNQNDAELYLLVF